MQDWLQNLDQDTVVIVPTRSLVNNLSEQIAKQKLAEGHQVWEAPNILLWSDYLNQLWQSNRSNMLNERAKHKTLISPQQALLIWTQVIEASKRSERSLTLLNVGQTAKAVQRSWRLMNDWRLEAASLENDHVADTEQFLSWVNAYRKVLDKRNFIDQQLLANNLQSIGYQLLFNKIVWYSYDLITNQQAEFNQYAIDNGVVIDYQQAPACIDQVINYQRFTTQKYELLAVLQDARTLIEQDPKATINIVVPDLQHRYMQVRDLARDVFYPAKSPLELQQLNCVYRFSLGEALKQWPAIETALTVIGLFKNRIRLSDFSFLLRNRFLRNCQAHSNECRIFTRWLKERRINTLGIDQLVELYQQCLLDLTKRDRQVDEPALTQFLQTVEDQYHLLKDALEKNKQDTGFAALSFDVWAQQITDWLTVWGWTTSIAGGDMSSVQFQLGQRWQSLLKEYAELSTVQSSAGLSRALEVLQQMASDGVFLPKAAASPILISGVFEAIGRPVTACFITGMNDAYPQPAKPDSFIANRFLQEINYPEASSDGSFNLARQVMNSLLNSTEKANISYALQNQQNLEVTNSVSALFRPCEFVMQEFEPPVTSTLQLEQYKDLVGPKIKSGTTVAGGASIFENQSNCEFKAFATHQLKFSREQEVEFGLDGLDRGNIIHILMDELWLELQTQANLKSLNDQERANLVSRIVGQALQNHEYLRTLNSDKLNLLRHEQPRLIALLLDWLQVEMARPTAFSVIEREEQNSAVFAGISFRYVIDRVDKLDDGRVIIIDYKTGAVARKDWLGNRMKSPQLPLYALAQDEKKHTKASGIAFANIKAPNSKYENLSEAGVFKTGRLAIKGEEEWLDRREQWPQIFERLAKDFLAGQAQVNPIDEKTCDYCDLKPVCRVSQLRKQTSQQTNKEDAGMQHD